MAKNHLGVTYPYFVCAGRHSKRTACERRAMPIDIVEALVEQHYHSVQPTEEVLAGVREVMREEITANRSHIAHERTLQDKRTKQLETERQKLLDAYYAGAVPIDLMKQEQTRIATELDAATRRLGALSLDLAQAEANLEAALKLAGNWYGVYRASRPTERRQLNQAIFERIEVRADGAMVHAFTQPFEDLLDTPGDISEDSQPGTVRYRRSRPQHFSQPDADLSGRVSVELKRRERHPAKKQRRPRENPQASGLSVITLVGRPGLEPGTCGLKVRCSTR